MPFPAQTTDGEIVQIEQKIAGEGEVETLIDTEGNEYVRDLSSAPLRIRRVTQDGVVLSDETADYLEAQGVELGTIEVPEATDADPGFIGDPVPAVTTLDAADIVSDDVAAVEEEQEELPPAA